jgi:hypothetical protein
MHPKFKRTTDALDVISKGGNRFCQCSSVRLQAVRTRRAVHPSAGVTAQALSLPGRIQAGVGLSFP